MRVVLRRIAAKPVRRKNPHVFTVTFVSLLYGHSSPVGNVANLNSNSHARWRKHYKHGLRSLSVWAADESLVSWQRQLFARSSRMPGVQYEEAIEDYECPLIHTEQQ
jgi:hypothetical protein